MTTAINLIRAAASMTGSILAAAFANPPETYYRAHCNALKTGIYIA